MIWIKEAKIKHVELQLKFFQSVVDRDYKEIRTKLRVKETINRLIKEKTVTPPTATATIVSMINASE